MKKDLVSILDLTREDIEKLFEIAGYLKNNNEIISLEGKTLALIFEKPSLRTRVSFEVAMTQLGGNTIYLSNDDIQLGKREPIKDIAKTLSRYVDAIAARTFKHETIEELAKYASVPVINALSDKEHPCQALADFLTIYEHFVITDVKLTYIGDVNNVCRSLILIGTLFGTEMRIAYPMEHFPMSISFITKRNAKNVIITNDPSTAIDGAEIIYTDTWTSMGQEDEREERKKIFAPYQVNKELLKNASPNYKIMHCLPAHRGEEITADVIDDSEHSIVLQQAENRLHMAKAILYVMLRRK